jgi:hypothetical protein
MNAYRRVVARIPNREGQKHKAAMAVLGRNDTAARKYWRCMVCKKREWNAIL